MWIEDLEELKKHVVVANDLTFESISERESEVIDEYMVDWFGQTLIDELHNYRFEDPASTKFKAFARMQKAIAKLMLRNHIPHIEVTVGDGGVTRISNENVTSAYAQQIHNLINKLEEDAFVQQDRLQDLLYANPADFPDWADSPGYTYNDRLFIRSAREFDSISRLYRKHQTYKAIYPTVERVQNRFVDNRYPDGVISTILPGTGLNDFKKKLREQLQRAIVFLTMKEAVLDGLVKLTGDGARLIMGDKDTHSQLEKEPTSAFISAQLRNYEKQAMSYLGYADKMVKENPTEFNLTAAVPATKKRFIA